MRPVQIQEIGKYTPALIGNSFSHITQGVATERGDKMAIFTIKTGYAILFSVSLECVLECSPANTLYPVRNIQKRNCRARQASSPREDLRTMSRVIVGLVTADRMWQPVGKADLNTEIAKLILPIQSIIINP